MSCSPRSAPVRSNVVECQSSHCRHDHGIVPIPHSTLDTRQGFDWPECYGPPRSPESSVSWLLALRSLLNAARERGALDDAPSVR